MVNPVDEFDSLLEYFSNAALVDPVSAMLLLVGGLLVAFASIIFFGLALGGIIEPIRQRFA